MANVVRPKQLKLILREEVLESGAPLPLADLLGRTSSLTIENEAVKELWAQTMDSLRSIAETHMPDVEVVMPKLWAAAAVHEGALWQGGEAMLVSMDAYDTLGAWPLRVSRHFAKDTAVQLGVGERPAAPPLDAQIERLKTRADGKFIVLLDDDTFTGGTAGHAIEHMQAVGLTVREFRPGLQVTDTLATCGVPIIPFERYDSAEVSDVVDPRDFLFGLKDAGLAIRDGDKLYRAPYILPWVDLTVRVSIPAEAAVALSLNIAKLNRQFYCRLERLVGKPIAVADTATAFQTFVADRTTCSPEDSMTTFCDQAFAILGGSYER